MTYVPNAEAAFLYLAVTEDPAFWALGDWAFEVRDWEACECSTEARFLAMLVNILRGSTRQSIGVLLKCKDLLFN